MVFQPSFLSALAFDFPWLIVGSTSNPAPFIHDNGSVLLVYKSAPVPYPERNKNRTLQFGVARADHYLGSYERVGENNRIEFAPIDTDVEDPYLWHDGEEYCMLAKCMNDRITGVEVLI